MDEADRCDRVALIQRGRLLADRYARRRSPRIVRPSAVRRPIATALRHAARAPRVSAHAHGAIRSASPSTSPTDALDLPPNSSSASCGAFLEARGRSTAPGSSRFTRRRVEDAFMARMRREPAMTRHDARRDHRARDLTRQVRQLRRRATASPSRCGRAKSSDFSAPTAPARRRRFAC